MTKEIVTKEIELKEKTYLTIKDMDLSDRPYEKFISKGEASLTDAELIAIIIKSGTKGLRATDLGSLILMKNSRGGLRNLLDMSLNDLTDIKGIGISKAIQLKAVCEIYRRLDKKDTSKKIYLTSKEEASQYIVPEMKHLKEECFKVLLLDTKLKLVKDVTVRTGSINEVAIKPAEIFKEAIANHIGRIMIVHNHPSGDITPSNADIEFTRRVITSSKILGIEVVDHLIAGDDAVFSFRESRIVNF